jgi:hypothetical protein
MVATQLDDLKKQLKDVEGNIKYCESMGISKDTNIFRYLIDRKCRIIDTMVNIR